MKILSILLLFSNISFTKTNDCTLSYDKFCNGAGKNYSNMCPVNLKSIKDMCLVKSEDKSKILNACEKETLDHCGRVDEAKFSDIYFCLTNPIKWEYFSKNCLSTLANIKLKK